MTHDPDRFVPDEAFVRDLEAAGHSPDVLRRLLPESIWPAEWRSESETATQEPFSDDASTQPNLPLAEIDDLGDDFIPPF